MENKKAVFKSGDEEDTGVRCFNCGQKFSDSLTGSEKVGDFVVCHCRGRGAYLTGFVSPTLPGNFEQGMAILRERTIM